MAQPNIITLFALISCSTMPIGKIESFEIGTHNWDAYCRRVKQFVMLNNIDESLHVAVLVTHVGVGCYELMCDLCAPDLPEKKTFDELEKIMKQHLEPQRSEIAERHVYRQRKQASGETVNEYLQSLKHLAKTCNFGKDLEVNIRDQFVSGLYSEDMRSRLFAERELDYKRAIELALALEAADRHAATSAVSSGGSVGSAGERAADGLHRVAAARAPRRQQQRTGGSGGGGGGEPAPASTQAAAPAQRRAAPCARCGKEGHPANRCRFKSYNCDNCGEKGHLKVMCRKYESGRGASSSGKTKGQFFLVDSDTDSEEVNFYNLSCDGGDDPYYVDLQVETLPLRFEVDTGCKFSAISKSCYNDLFNGIELHKKTLILKSYTGDVIKPLGFINVKVSYGTLSYSLPLYVIENGGPPLMGRTWIRMLNVNINDCYNLTHERHDSTVETLRKEYPEVFADGLGTCKIRMQLHLSDKTPVYVKARPLPLALRAPVERELERLQRDDVIYKVDRSDYGTPIVPVVKKNGDIRICGDYKTTINPLLKDFHYPLPRIEEIFATLAGGVVFSKLDLSHAYQQFCLTEDSQPMTAISTHVGTWVYKRVPFGIKCIPENFQKVIEEILSGLPSTVVFCDDICISGLNAKNNLENVRAVLMRLRDAGLRVNWSKCEFFKESVTYLGYRIDKHGLHADEKKIEAIVSAPVPKDVSQLKSFLGLVNFYAKFCYNISDILKPMYELLKKDVKWSWSEQCEIGFNKIKSVLSSSPVLAHYDPKLPLILSVDSSSYGLGAVLAHRYPDGSERAVSCASRTLNSHELNYSQLDKEALAIIFGVTKHHQYLYGRHFLLRSDHRALSYIFGKNKGIPQTAASRLQRYAVRLAAYDYDIDFIPSSRNCYADALSRLPLERTVRHNYDEDILEGSYLNFVQDVLPVTCYQVKVETNKDSQLNKIVGYVKFGWPERLACEKEKVFFLKRDNLFIEHGCLVWGYRVVIPTTLRGTVLRELHSGHIGIVKMKQAARNYFWWEGLDADIERTCRECSACASQRDQPPPAPLHSWPWPAEPWSRLNVDFLGPYRNKYYFVLLDAHTKWLEVAGVSSTSAPVVISCLRKMFARFGLPKSIVSDNGPPFSSKEYSSYLEKNGIKRLLVAPYHPASNGAAENAVRTVKQVLKKATFEGEDYEVAISRFLFTYRNTEHCTTQKEPALAMFGRRLRGRLDLLRPSTGEVVRAAQAAAEQRRAGVSRDLAPGDNVLVRDYVNKDVKWKEGVIVDKTGPVSFQVKTQDNRMSKRHVDQLLTKNSRKSRYSVAGVEPSEDNDARRVESNVDEGWSTPLTQSPTSVPVTIGDAECGARSYAVDLYERAKGQPAGSSEKKRQHPTSAPHSMTLRSRLPK